MGFTHISEDSSEIAFLLVENYFKTAPSSLRTARESLEHTSLRSNFFFSLRLVLLGWREEENLTAKRETNQRAKQHKNFTSDIGMLDSYLWGGK